MAGFAGFSHAGSRWDLASLHVDRRFQGRGIGKALIREVFRRAGEAGAEEASSPVVLANTRVRTLYERQGAVFQSAFSYFFANIPVACGRYRWTLPRAE